MRRAPGQGGLLGFHGLAREPINNFGIRHHRTGQKTDYDKPIFYSWMFHHYLAAIHAAVRLIERRQG